MKPTSILVSLGHKPGAPAPGSSSGAEDAGGDDGDDADEHMLSAAEDLISAVNQKDAKGVCDAFHDMMGLWKAPED